MKHPERLLPGLFIAMLAGGFYACQPDDIEPVKTGPDTIQTEYGQIVVSEDYVPIDWDKSGNEVLRIDVPSPQQATVTMAIADKKLAAQVQKGSIITVDVDTAIYLRKVVSSTIDGTTVTAVTTQATLEDVFSGSEFELCLGDEPDCELFECGIDEDAIWPDSLLDEEEEEEFYPYNGDSDDASYAPWLRGRNGGSRDDEAAALPNVRRVTPPTRRLPQFKPTEMRYRDENGEWVRESYDAYCARTTTRGDEPGSIHFELGGPDILDLHSDPKDTESGFSLGVKGGATFKCDLGFKMTTNYPDGEFVSTYRKGKCEITPLFFFKPSLELSAQFYIKMSKVLSKETTKKIGAKKLAHISGPKAVFAIGPVPMMVAANADFYAEPEFTFTAEVDFTVAGTAGTSSDVELGIKWNQKKGQFSRVFNQPEFSWTAQKPTLGINGSAEAKLYVYPQFDVLLYDIIGPYVAYKPYIRTTVSAGINTTTGLCWKWDAALGNEFAVGVKAEVIGYDLAKKDFVSKKFGKEIQLWNAPNNLSASNTSDLKPNQMNKISLTVENKILAWKHTNTWLPVFVRFETENDAKEIYEDGSSGGTAHSALTVEDEDGVVSVNWKPQSLSSALTASIYAPDGHMIDCATFHPDNTPEGAKGIDMGTGILWANMNLGATAPEDSGDYFGWGDGSGTHREQCFDATYGKYVEDENAVYKYYGGTEPHSNISGTKFDVVTRKWGSGWRMPTYKEWEKLLKSSTFSYNASKDAYEVTNNGKTLIFPAAGCEIGTDYSSLTEKSSGEYWTATLKTKEPTNAWYIGMTGSGKKAKSSHGSVPRYYLQSIRPVMSK